MRAVNTEDVISNLWINISHGSRAKCEWRAEVKHIKSILHDKIVVTSSMEMTWRELANRVYRLADLALPAKKKSFEGSGTNRRYSRKTMKSMRNDRADAIFSVREYR